MHVTLSHYNNCLSKSLSSKVTLNCSKKITFLYRDRLTQISMHWTIGELEFGQLKLTLYNKQFMVQVQQKEQTLCPTIFDKAECWIFILRKTYCNNCIHQHAHLISSIHLYTSTWYPVSTNIHTCYTVSKIIISSLVYR